MSKNVETGKPTSLKTVIVTIRKSLNAGKSLPLFVELICGVLLLYSNIYSNNNTMANAQTFAPLAPSTNVSDIGRPTIQITSPQDDQHVPSSELSIQHFQVTEEA